MSPLRRFLYILLLTAMWSPSFLFIKIIIQEIPTLTTIALRVTLAAIALLIILRLKKRSLPTDLPFWCHSAAMAFLCSVLPFYLFAYAEQYIDSAMASILNGTSPMFTAVFAHFLIPSDRLSIQKVIGITLSVCGIALLFSSQYYSQISAGGRGGQQSHDSRVIGRRPSSLLLFLEPHLWQEVLN